MRGVRLRAGLTGLLALILLTAPASPATATFDGENGRIAFRRFLDLDQTTAAIFTTRPDGTGERQVTHPESGVVDRNPDVSPDGQRIVRVQPLHPDPPTDRIQVVLNWFEELRRAVP